MGRWPMCTMGLGRSSASRIRMPCPPQNKTTFIKTLRLRPFSPAAARQGGRCAYDLLQPAFAAEVTVLLRPQLVAQPIRRQCDIFVSDDRVFGHVADQH